MKKTIFSLLIGSLLTLSVHAQTTVPQGGTGVTSVPDKYILMGSTTLRLQSVSTTTLSSLLNVPTSASTTNWNSFFDTPSTRITAGTNLSWSGNTLNGLADSAIRGLFSSSATGLTYTSGTGAFSLTSGYVIPLTASTTEWATAFASTTNMTPSYMRGLFANSATGLTYDNSTGATSLTAGYNIPLTASTTNWNSFWDTPSTRITAGANCSWASNTFNCSGGGGGSATTTINGASGPAFTFNASSTGATDFAISTSTGIVTFHIPDASATARGFLSTTTQTIAGAKTFTGSNAYGTPASITLTNGTGLPVSSGISGLGTGIATALGINVGSAGAPVLFNGALGTPSSGTLTNATGLPIATGVSGLGAGIATWLATPSSANLATALTTKTGSGLAVFDTSPTLVTPILGVASSTAITIPTLYSTVRANIWGLLADSTNATGTSGMVLSSTGTSTQWITPNAGTVTAVSVASANGFAGSSSGGATPQLTLSTTATGLLQGNGTAISGITNSSTVGQVLRTTGASTYAWGALDLADTDAVTGTLAVANGGTGITSLGAGVATWLGTPSAANLRSAVTGTTGTAGNLVFSTSPTLTTPILGVASSTALSVSGDFWVTGTSTQATSTVSRFTASGHSTLATASSTGLTSSGTLNVSGQTTLATASSTGLTGTNLYSTNLTTTSATTTNIRVSGPYYDSLNALGTSGQVLQSTGTSTKWTTAAGGGGTQVATATTTVTFSSNTSENTVFTASVPANTLGTTGGVRLTLYVSSIRTFNTGTITVRFKYGATTLSSITFGGANTLSESGKYEWMLLSTGVTNGQKGIVASQIGTPNLQPNVESDSQYLANISEGTSAIDSTSAQNLVVTMQASGNSPSDGYTVNMGVLEKIVQ